jgi:hypothetical protein
MDADAYIYRGRNAYSRIACCYRDGYGNIRVACVHVHAAGYGYAHQHGDGHGHQDAARDEHARGSGAGADCHSG